MIRASWSCTYVARYHSVRKCKEYFFTTMYNKMLFKFPDRVV